MATARRVAGFACELCVVDWPTSAGSRAGAREWRKCGVQVPLASMSEKGSGKRLSRTGTFGKRSVAQQDTASVWCVFVCDWTHLRRERMCGDRLSCCFFFGASVPRMITGEIAHPKNKFARTLTGFQPRYLTRPIHSLRPPPPHPTFSCDPFAQPSFPAFLGLHDF